MKFYLKPVLSALAVVVLLGYSGCGPSGGDGPSEEEVQLAQLTTTWKVGSAGDVKFDGKSKKADYASFQLILTGTPGSTAYSYTTSGRPPLSPWPAAGAWNFGTIITEDVIRDKGTNAEVPMKYVVNGNNLELTFNYNYSGEPARAGEVKGTWVFTLTK